MKRCERGGNLKKRVRGVLEAKPWLLVSQLEAGELRRIRSDVLAVSGVVGQMDVDGGARGRGGWRRAGGQRGKGAVGKERRGRGGGEISRQQASVVLKPRDSRRSGSHRQHWRRGDFCPCASNLLDWKSKF